jgi:signal transduction histidine kinase
MSDTSHLFQPFRPGSDGSGLGLYVSREMVKSFGGELHHIPTPEGCCFQIIIPIVLYAEQKP